MANGSPRPIDARMPRFNQGVLAVALIVGFVFRWTWVIPVWAAVLFLGAAFGARYGPFLRFFRDVIAPRLGPPTTIEDPRPPRFAAAIGTVFLAVGTLALVSDHSGIAWALALIVAALAALAAVTGICIGCELYVWIKRHSRTGWADASEAGA
jgi:hypothetical protein